MRPAERFVEESVRVVGDGWSLSLDTGTHRPWQRQVHARHRASRSISAPTGRRPRSSRNGSADETAAFLRGVLTGEMPGPTAADAMPGTELAAELEGPD